MRLARAYDEAMAGDEAARASPRIATAGRQVLDLQARARCYAGEALECLGGNGYVEESGRCRGCSARRRSTAIWEGSGNVSASTCCGR